jgi:phosphoribosyl 1,2-cyclic phosphodiesterase
MLCTQAFRSGSSGNAIFVSDGKSHLLVDAGITGKGLAGSLFEVGADADDIAGILVTHEHVDHISGLGVLLRQYRLPLYISEETFLSARERIGRFDESLLRFIEGEKPFQVADFEVIPVPISHDAADPFAFRIEHEKGRISICTDTGELTERMMQILLDCEVVHLEANYDDNMLAFGPYPQRLKKRIRGRFGHLSNDESGRALIEFVRNGTEKIVLSHLSKDNNLPELALACVKRHLSLIGARENLDYQLIAANRYDCSPRVLLSCRV